MKTSFYKTTWLAGIAIFCMFFGAGNVIFPLKVGLLAGDQIAYALGGLLLTAIGGPLLGLVGATLYQGNCLEFFSRSGKILGLAFITISLILLGPFAVIPRCFVVALSSMNAAFGETNPFAFTLIFGIISLLCCIKQNLILPLLGRFFSPILILSLLLIIIVGTATGSPLQPGSLSASETFLMGLEEGYETMDLIAAIFFSSSIWALLIIKMQETCEKKIAKTAIVSGLIGGSLLGIIYIGLGFATAFHADELAGVPPEKLMSTLAIHTLGPFWSNIANLAVVVACFTTAVGLTQTIAALCVREFFPNTLRYNDFLIGITFISMLFANLGFAMISAVIHPLISICYPAIIVLTILNISHKIYGFTMVKRPVYGTLFSSTLLKSLHFIGGL